MQAHNPATVRYLEARASGSGIASRGTHAPRAWLESPRPLSRCMFAAPWESRSGLLRSDQGGSAGSRAGRKAAGRSDVGEPSGR
jgi:hypothetical protein